MQRDGIRCLDGNEFYWNVRRFFFLRIDSGSSAMTWKRGSKTTTKAFSVWVRLSVDVASKQPNFLVNTRSDDLLRCITSSIFSHSQSIKLVISFLLFPLRSTEEDKCCRWINCQDVGRVRSEINFELTPCRAHDHCFPQIAPGECLKSICNHGVFTRLHCGS